MYGHTFMIDVATDFTLLASERTVKDGEHSAEVFFEMMCMKVNAYGKVIVCFDGMLAVGSSFLHELAKLTIDNNIVDKVIVICNDDKYVKEKYNKYIKEIQNDQ